MSEKNDGNPLSLIFMKTKNGEISEELDSIGKIDLFFEYLSNEEISQEKKIEVIDIFIKIIKVNRYICEYFSTYNNESIYIFLFKLYLLKSSSKELKTAIINLLSNLIINIETNKNIYEYLFQNFSAIYRNEEESSPENLYDLLTLLNTILGETDEIQKPRNYFSCSGKGKFEVDLREKKIELGTYLTFIISFKIASSLRTKEDPESASTCELIKIAFSNEKFLTVELKNQMYLKIKESPLKDFIRLCPPNEWINLIVNIINSNNYLDIFFFFNGENSLQSHIRMKPSYLKCDDYIDSIVFFNNFYGEVSSMSMAATNEANDWSMSTNFLKWFLNYKEGFWKKKYLDNFFDMLIKFVPIATKTTKYKTISIKNPQTKDNNNQNQKNYLDYFVFIYTPFNCLKINNGIVENSLGKIELDYDGNIRNHQYQCYQKKLNLVSGITSLIPLAELFLIRPKIINEENLVLFLKIIINILKNRNYNIKTAKDYKLFQILSLFFEKYPNHLFTEKIVGNFRDICKTIFAINDDILCSSFFEYFFLNEKIVSKYSENLQNKLWEEVLLFCQTDVEQVETFMNLNRICLILRFYDKNKYSEMCCEKHLAQIKEEYIGNKTVMNPIMEKRLLNLEKVLNLVLQYQDPANVISLFKLLTLDLSPCLTKFIVNILSNELGDPTKKKEWKKKLINEFINNKYETIIINTFIHSLPDVRFDILELIYQIYTNFSKIQKTKNFTTLEKMLKVCLLPKKMFYATYKESKSYLNEIKRKKNEENKNKSEEQCNSNYNKEIDSRNDLEKMANEREGKKDANDIEEKKNNDENCKNNEEEGKKNKENLIENEEGEKNNEENTNTINEENLKVKVEENKKSEENTKINEEAKKNNNENNQINEGENIINGDILKKNEESKTNNEENLEINEKNEKENIYNEKIEEDQNLNDDENLKKKQEVKGIEEKDENNKENTNNIENIKTNEEENKNNENFKLLEGENAGDKENLNINEESNKNDVKIEEEDNKNNENIKTNEEGKKEENLDDELDLDFNLNINQQIEINNSDQKPKQINISSKEKEEKNNEEKANETKQIEHSKSTESSLDNSNTVNEKDKINISEEEKDNNDNATTTKNDKNEKEKTKQNEEEDEEEDINFEDDENAEKEMVIKDEIYNDYINTLFESLLVWSFGVKVGVKKNTICLDKLGLTNLNILEIIFALIKEVNDINLTLNFFESIEKTITHEDNSLTLLNDKKIYALFTETTFNFYKKEGTIEKKIYETGKSILLGIFINSFKCIEKKIKDQKNQKNNEYNYNNPCYEIDSFFLWCDKTNKSKDYCQKAFDFLIELLLELMIQYKINFEKKMNFKVGADIKSNFYLKNYIIMLTQLFCFSFHFENPLENVNDINLKENIMEKYTNYMHLDLTKNKINEMWMNFSFFDDLYKRISCIWDKDHIFKNYNLGKTRNKVSKYESILKTIILDKNKKNVFQSELTFLTYEEKCKDNNEIIIPLIRTIPITLMSIITVIAKKGNDPKHLLYWVKEYKKFIRFIIIAATNLSRVNQQDFYTYIQDKCLGTIIMSICFFRDLLKTTTICKEKIRNSFYSLIVFCCIITKYQYTYINKHKSGLKIFNIAAKPARNDLKLSAVFLLFSDFFKDKFGNVLLPLEKLDQSYISQFVNIIDSLDNKEWNEALFNNPIIKEKIIKEFFTFVIAKKIKDKRNYLIKEINDINNNYTEEILELLPSYERELSKYSNNSLENAIKKKNLYKAIKKKSFSWKGLWSDRQLFFDDIEQLKLKLINHYTKTFMKPILAPILDVEYYLPEFSGFKVNTLFEKNNKNKERFKLIMDIDKILKLSEQNQIAMNKVKDNLGEKKIKTRENYLRKIYLKSNKELAESLKKITNSLDFGKEIEFTNVEHSTEKNNANMSKGKNVVKKNHFLACLVKTSHHIKGVCFIDEKCLNFKVFLDQRIGNSMSGVELAFKKDDDDYDHDRQTCFGSYFVCHPKDKDLYQISINYNEIKWIFRRRYYYKNSGIEIFTTTNKSFYFNFKKEEDRETIINDIVNKIKETSKIYDDMKDPKDNFDNIIGFENTEVNHSKKKLKKTKLSKKIEMWKNREINNFELLMWLNIYGNRSYNDISQYPVFPWILSDYTDPLKKSGKSDKNLIKRSTTSLNYDSEEEEDDTNINSEDYKYRDLSLPMGMIALNEEGEKRKEKYMETYDTLKNESDGEIKPYIYGTNYSNPMYVCNFMTRLFPFTHIAIELQGSKFDNPDRLFLSVDNSFYNSVTQTTDVRELIPEFFYLPEMFLNINKLNLGTLENGTTVNNVLTPCANDPYIFVMTMRSVLESEKISKNIQNWVDLIFGYKNRGKDAETFHNLYSEASYQENININKLENKEAMLRQVEFGLIPTQILNKECGKRIKKEDVLKGKEIIDPNCKLFVNECKKHSDSQYNRKEKKDLAKSANENKEKNSILCVSSFGSEKLSILYNNDIYIEKKISSPVFDKVYIDEQINKINLNKKYNKMSEFYSNDSTNNNAISFFQHGKSVIMGGFFDGKVYIVPLDTKLSPQILFPFKDESPVLSIACDKDEDFIFMGNDLGNVSVYKNNNGNFENIYLLSDQSSPISHIYCSDELNLLATASIDGYICLYTLPLCKLVRCLKVPFEKCSYVFLSDSPLPSIIVINKESNSEIHTYSINGKFYKKIDELCQINNPCMIKDIDSKDYLAYIANDEIKIISLPDLNIQIKQKVKGIHSFCFSEDNKIIYSLNSDGTEVKVIKEEKLKFYRSASFMK